jgi:predicted transposase YbfD/YdcC
LRASFDNTKGLGPLHTVSAFVAESNFVLGEVFVNTKENEIVVIPELLKLLELKGAIVTIDAMGCQKKIAEQICNDKEADYILALKRNHPDLYDEVSALFRLAETHEQIHTDFFCSNDKGHGRVELRECTCIEARPWLDYIAGEWTNLTTVAKIVSKVERKGKYTEETRYFLSSLPCSAKEIACAVREHWRIENTLHWSLDVVFKEDHIHIRKDNSPKNLSIIRRIAFSLAKERTPEKMSTKRAQLRSILSQKFATQHFFKN